MSDLRSGVAPLMCGADHALRGRPHRAGVKGQRRRVRGEDRQGSVSRGCKRQERGQGHGKGVGEAREAPPEGSRRRGKAEEAGVRSTRRGCPADGPDQGTQARNQRALGDAARLVPCRSSGAFEGACEAGGQAGRCEAGRCKVNCCEAGGQAGRCEAGRCKPAAASAKPAAAKSTAAKPAAASAKPKVAVTSASTSTRRKTTSSPATRAPRSAKTVPSNGSGDGTGPS